MNPYEAIDEQLQTAANKLREAQDVASPAVALEALIETVAAQQAAIVAIVGELKAVDRSLGRGDA